MKRTTFLVGLLVVMGLLVGLIIPGCDELVTERISITTAGNPDAEFDLVGIDSGCAPFSVQFVDKSVGPRDKWLWSFGDGDSSTDTAPTHIYDSSGTYTVSLRIDDSPTGGNDTETKGRFLIVGESVSKFEASDSSGCPGLEVVFTPTVVGGVVSYRWTFGDGTPVSLDSSPTHVYATPGNYDVTLQITGGCGTASLTDSGFINILTCPTIAIDQDTTECCAPCMIQFFDSTTVATGESSVDQWEWDFGNGTQSAEQNPLANFDAAGVYTITLTATSPTAGSATDSFVDHIIVGEQTTADFVAVGAVTRCYNPANPIWILQFDNQSVGFDSTVWEFTDPNSVTQAVNAETIAWPFTVIGRYTVSLTAYGDCGTDVSARTNYITLYDDLDSASLSIFTALTSDPLIEVDTAIAGESVTFDIVTDAMVVDDYEWDFGDTNTTTGTILVPVTHTFDPVSSDTTYTVTLTLNNGCGSRAVTKDFRVLQIP